MQTILLYERVKYLPITKENKPVIEGCVLGRLLNLTFLYWKDNETMYHNLRILSQPASPNNAPPPPSPKKKNSILLFPYPA